MKSIAAIQEQLDQEADLNAIRCDIADLILHYLQISRTSNSPAALDHLTNAVGTLTLNVYAEHQPHKAGLDVCLMDIERAITELNEPNSIYRLLRERVEAVTYTMLAEAVKRIRHRASYAVEEDGQNA
jgi:hypothetical protein